MNDDEMYLRTRPTEHNPIALRCVIGALAVFWLIMAVLIMRAAQ